MWWHKPLMPATWEDKVEGIKVLACLTCTRPWVPFLVLQKISNPKTPSLGGFSKEKVLVSKRHAEQDWSSLAYVFQNVWKMEMFGQNCAVALYILLPC